MTLAEAAIATVLVGTMLVAALNAVVATRRSQQRADRSARAVELAESLMAEILTKPYAEDADGGGLGPSLSEASTGDRSLFDDVDDYAGWNETPPRDKLGTLISGFSDWSRSVTVVWETPEGVMSVSETGIKRITLTVSYDGVEVVTVSALRVQGVE
ncbi:MAG: hypothetical protein KDA32_14440 [Phycisphaerales bacterium]|nr:hypothetical protein [Phycisphaerales bacterium]